MLRTITTVVLLGLFGACASGPGYISGTYGDYGALARPVTTSVADAQVHFDRGLVLMYGFNHDEAVREFEMAAELDPQCAMAWWGIAHCLAPNINLPLTDADVAQRGHEMAQRALAESSNATPVERGLIEAMAKRFASPPPADRKSLDVAYANAMREVWKRFPDDADVGVLFADSMLNLRPWDQWTPEGAAQPGTMELVGALERVLDRNPGHIGGNHLYIHSIEASKTPERALGAANRLRDANITAVGHLLHMPSHIYVRTGRYVEAAKANELAVTADRAYFAKAGPQGIYEFYKAHNHHFLLYSAMFMGDRETALRAAREGAAEISDSAKNNLAAFADCYMPMSLHAMIRFGAWEDILEEEPFPAQFPIAVATYHYARGIALTNLERQDEAAQEAEQFMVAKAAVPEDSLIVATPAHLVMDVAELMLRGEMAYRQGEHDAAFAFLREAVAKEDALPYDEPRGWMQPVRHALGALLLETGNAQAAELVYRADLERHPNNGWSLHGLAECLTARGAEVEAAEVTADFDKAWTGADVAIEASCYCREE